MMTTTPPIGRVYGPILAGWPRGETLPSPHHVRAYVGLGANLGDPPSTLAAAVHALAALPGVRLRAVSPLYLSRPVGRTGQPDFHNAVVALDVPTGPEPAVGGQALLLALKGIERAFGRRAGERWGPRELDLDLLVFGRHRFSAGDGELSIRVPHPRAAERLFVLAPLADLAPHLRPPGWPETAAAVAQRHTALEGPEAVRRIGVWQPKLGRWVSD
jgi:2-amino-4-hydroxy-6-hydroxymethyldihydropteridine diphosphokinase